MIVLLARVLVEFYLYGIVLVDTFELLLLTEE